MQPYFFPYLPYYQLISSVDIFVVYDCVQFPRRGWVHRNKFSLINEKLDFLTLAIEKSPRDTKIKNILLKKDYLKNIKDQIKRFAILQMAYNKNSEILSPLFFYNPNLSEYLFNSIEHFASIFLMKTKIIKSSDLKVPENIKGQGRIIEILRRLSATHYLNASGGKNLYDPNLFTKNKLKLSFLKNYNGNKSSMLERILKDDINILKEELFATETINLN